MKYIHFFFCLLLGMAVQAQIKIGDNPQNIDPSSVLELESSSRVLVITRVNTAQMNAIIPSAGAMVYNTDIQCIHYYTGTEWKDICDAVAGSITFTSDDGTVVITSTGGNNYDLKVGQITGMNIVNETVFGADIATATIGERQLAPNSVGASELQDNTVGKDEIQEAAVGTLEIIDGTIQPSDMQPGAFDQILTTDAGGNVVWLNKNELGATQTDQTTITGAGTAADPIKVADTVIGDILANANNISQNSADIAANTVALGTKEDVANKSDDTNLGNSTTLYPTQNAVKTYVDLAAGAVSSLNNANIFVGNAGNVATGVAMSGDATINNTGVVTIANNAVTNDKLDKANIPLSGFGAAAAPVSLGTNRLTNVANPTATDDAATKAYVDAQTIVSTDIPANSITVGTDGGAYYVDGDDDDTNELQTISLTGNNLILSDGGGSVPLPSGADGVVTGIITTGNNLVVTGSGGGFNGNVNLEPLVDNAVSNNGYLTAEVDGSITNEIITASSLTGTTLTITEGGNDFDIDLTGLGGGSADGVISLVELNGTDLDFTGSGGGFNGTIDLSPIDTTLDESAVDAFVANNGYLITEVDGSVTNETITASSLTGTTLTITEGGVDFDIDLTGLGGGSQDLASVLTNGSSAGNSQINDLLDPTLPQDAATQNYVETRIATILASGGVDGVISNAFLSGTEIDFVGTNGGFNGTVDLDPVFATDAELSSNLALKEDAANKSTDVNLADATNTLFPTELAVKTYVDTQITTVSDDDITAVSFDGTDLTVTEGATSFSADISALDDSAAIATVQADVDANETAANNAIALKEDTANKSTDVNLADATNTLFPTELAVKTYVDTQIATVSDDDITAVSFDGTDLTVTEGATSFSADISALDDSAAIATVQADVDANETAANNAIALKEDTANKSTDVNLADATNTLFPTELAVKTYVDTQITTVSDDDITAVSFDGTDLTVTEGATSFSADISALDDSAAIATVQADVDANETAANNAIALKEDAANKSTDINLADATNTLFPTELAVKTYVDTQIAGAAADDDITAVSFDGTNLTVTEGATSFFADISALDNSAAIALKEDTANKSTNVNLGNSDALFPTQNAVKTYVDTEIAGAAADDDITAVSFDGTNLTVTEGATSFFADISALDDSAAVALKEDTANKSTNVNLGNSDVLYPTQNAVKTYVDTEIAGAAADDDITAVTFDGTNLTVTEGATSFFADISVLDDSAAIALKEDTANKSTDVNLADATNTLFPTELAVKTYVDTQVAAATGHTGTTGSIFFAAGDQTPTEDNSNFFWDDTNNRLGIGTDSPDAAIHVFGNGQVRAGSFRSGSGTVSIPAYRFTDDVNTGMFLANTGEIAFSTSSTEAMRIDDSQNVGIGTISPDERLHVADNMRLDGAFEDKDGEKGTSGQILSSTGTGVDWINPPTASGTGTISSGTLDVTGGANAAFSNVSIEIADGAITSAKIATNAIVEANIVNGAVSSNKITDQTIQNIDISPTAAIDGSKINPVFNTNVSTTGGFISGGTTLNVPDYVFQKYFLGNSLLKESYNFQTLAQIEAFVKVNHHLPGIKSAEEVKLDGVWNLSKSNLQNLEKIEELFLHTIEQEKKIDQLKNENQSLSAELQSLRKDMDEIKALLKNKH